MKIANDEPKIYYATNLTKFTYWDDVDIAHVETLNEEPIEYSIDEGRFLLHFDESNNLVDIEIFDWKRNHHPIDIKIVDKVILRSFIGSSELILFCNGGGTVVDF